MTRHSRWFRDLLQNIDEKFMSRLFICWCWMRRGDRLTRYRFCWGSVKSRRGFVRFRCTAVSDYILVLGMFSEVFLSSCNDWSFTSIQQFLNRIRMRSVLLRMRMQLNPPDALAILPEFVIICHRWSLEIVASLILSMQISSNSENFGGSYDGRSWFIL